MKRKRQQDTVAYPKKAKRTILKTAMGEIKFVNTTVSTTADTTGAVTLLSGMVKGDSEGERIGQRVTYSYIKGTLYFKGGSNGTAVGWGVIYDKHPNGSAPSIAGVIEGTPDGTNVIPKPTWNNRFTVLKSGHFKLGDNAGNISDDNLKVVNFNANLKMRQQIFNSGNAGTVADIEEGGIFLVTWGERAAGATAATVLGRISIGYRD